MFERFLDNADMRFRTSAEIRTEIIRKCRENPCMARYCYLGKSRQKRIIDAVILGKGPKTISLIAGAHADEPVGSETLRTFILQGIERKKELGDLFERYRFLIIPHINPDGEMMNRRWITRWPKVEAYLLHACREQPGEDIEFGFPDLRPENRCAALFLEQQSPINLHISFHGMGFSEGAMLLIERHWIDRTKTLRRKFVTHAKNLGFSLHDHDRKGQKGFHYIGAGFTTTPERVAMQKYFSERGDHIKANLFHDSSMDFVRKNGTEPLCLVTELPLYIVSNPNLISQPGHPASYLAFKDRKEKMVAKLLKGESIDADKREFEITPVDLKTAIKLHMEVLNIGLEAIQ